MYCKLKNFNHLSAITPAMGNKANAGRKCMTKTILRYILRPPANFSTTRRVAI